MYFFVRYMVRHCRVLLLEFRWQLVYLEEGLHFSSHPESHRRYAAVDAQDKSPKSPAIQSESLELENCECDQRKRLCFTGCLKIKDLETI